MCGIVGFIDPERGDRALGALLDAMTHRGPDGEGRHRHGALFMGMRRLSIIDLEGGWQPLRNSSGDVVAFNNGEIYNYRELRAELARLGYVFRTGSDTEVLAHGYESWGIEGLLRRLDGMFALAILDARRSVLHLARDRLGEKPLYLARAPGRFAYGSSMLALAALPWVGEEIDPVGLDRYLAMHFVPGDRTVLRNVRKLLPGHRAEIPLEDPEPRVERYWRPPTGAARRKAPGLAGVVEEAVRSRLVADVPVGVFLSGGLDSSLVAAIAARHAPEVNTFSIGFEDKSADETPFIRRVVGHIGAKHRHFTFDGTSFNELLPKVARALDEPIGDQAALPLYRLCQESSKHVTVALSGEGADEVFAGYGYYAGFAAKPGARRRIAAFLRGRVRSGGAPRAAFLDEWAAATPSGFPLLAGAADRLALAGRTDGEVEDYVWEAECLRLLDEADDDLARATLADTVSWLPDDLLVKFDRMSMAHGLEGRAPYLAEAVVAAGACLPAEERMGASAGKIALRRVARRWLPDGIVDREKHGFVLPMRRWLGSWFEAAGGPESYFLDRALPGLDGDYAARLAAADLERGVARERLLMALAMLVEWWNAFLEQRAALARSLDRREAFER